MGTAPDALRVALVGLMGAGKTRAGTLIAEVLGWPFHDADRMVEAAAGMTVPEIFDREQESGFRVREAEVVNTLAVTAPPLVVAMGGGVVEEAANREMLARDFFVVWIQIDPREAARRLKGKVGRPLLDTDDPERVLQTLAARRSPYYLELADLRVGTEASTRPEDLCGKVIDALGGRSRKR